MLPAWGERRPSAATEQIREKPPADAARAPEIPFLRPSGSVAVPFKNSAFASSERLQRAAENAPAMRRGEKDSEAVRILQQALIGVGVATMRRSLRPDGSLDGLYGSETVKAVRRFQEKAGLAAKGKGDGITGRNTLRGWGSKV